MSSEVVVDPEIVADLLSRESAARLLTAERERDEPRQPVIDALVARLDRDSQEVSASA